MFSKVIAISFLTILLNIPDVNSQYVESEWEDRDKWMKVTEIFQIAGLRIGDDVADIGCHEGYMSFHLADFIGATGKVYSVDVREDRLNDLNEIAATRGIGNIKTILGNYDDPKLQGKTLDAVLIIDAYHEMNDYMQILDHVKKALKPNGRILILEKLKRHMIGKSREEQTKAHTISPEYVEKELKEAGFVVTLLRNDLGYWEEDPDKKIWVMVGVLTPL
jgi:ubiquinone/menaquinone biosynthesis C-methylase UbiE